MAGAAALAYRQGVTAAELNQVLDWLGWTGVELASRVEVDPGTVSHWRNGHSRIPGAVKAYVNLVHSIRRAME